MKWYEVGCFDWPLGVAWFGGKVGRRLPEFWAPITQHYAAQFEREGHVRPHRGRAVRKREVNWRGPARLGAPVWGWRARVLAWACLHQRLKGVPQRKRDGQNVLGVRLQRELVGVARGNAPWSVSLEGRVGEAIAGVRARWAARNASLPPKPGQPRRFRLRMGTRRGPTIGR